MALLDPRQTLRKHKLLSCCWISVGSIILYEVSTRIVMYNKVIKVTSAINEHQEVSRIRKHFSHVRYSIQEMISGRLQ